MGRARSITLTTVHCLNNRREVMCVDGMEHVQAQSGLPFPCLALIKTAGTVAANTRGATVATLTYPCDGFIQELSG